MKFRHSVSFVALLIVLAACGGSETPDLERVPSSPTATTLSAPTDDLQVPLAYSESPLIDPQWDTEGQYADGVYLGAQETETHLEFTAISDTGEALWTVDRPLSCTGFTLGFTGDGRALAILGDTESSDDALAATTVSAYELHTGDLVWGPIDVPGPYIGPGLVYGKLDGGTLGQASEHVALDINTGEIAVSDTDSEVILGEYDGTILTVVGDDLVARAGERETWRINLAEHSIDPADVLPDMGYRAGDTTILVKVKGAGGIMVDKDTGDVLFTDVRDAVRDYVSGVWTIRDSTGVHAYDEMGTLLWSQSVSDNTEFEVAGGSLLYMRDGDSLRVHNLYTGAIAQAYTPDQTGTIVVPAFIADNGTALLWVDGRQIIATVESMSP